MKKKLPIDWSVIETDKTDNTNKTNTYQKQNNTKGNIATTYKQ